jgi:hypothetical protein
LVFVVVWSEYLVAALAFAWIPSFLDSLLPFSLLAAELFLAQFIYHDLQRWLLAMAAASIVALVALIHTRLRVGGGDADQRALFRAISGPHLINILAWAVGALLFLGAGLLYDRLGLGEARTAVVGAATLLIVLYLSRGVTSWQRIQRYVQGAGKAA